MSKVVWDIGVPGSKRWPGYCGRNPRPSSESTLPDFEVRASNPPSVSSASLRFCRNLPVVSGHLHFGRAKDNYEKCRDPAWLLPSRLNERAPLGVLPISRAGRRQARIFSSYEHKTRCCVLIAVALNLYLVVFTPWVSRLGRAALNWSIFLVHLRLLDLRFVYPFAAGSELTTTATQTGCSFGFLAERTVASVERVGSRTFECPSNRYCGNGFAS
jgi:hypothetical protein